MGNDRTPSERRATVAEAARILGISAEAVRGRIRRGTLRVERENGKIYVLLEGADEDRTNADQPRIDTDRPDRTDTLIAELQDRIRALEEANRENWRIIAALTARIPAIEAPSDEREVASARIAARANHHVTDPLTMLVFAAGAGVAAGIGNPLIIVRTENLLWLPVLLLWVLPPVFGYWVGRSFAFLRVEALAALETLRQERMRVVEGSEQAVSLDLRIGYWENRTEPGITTLYAMCVGLFTVPGNALVTSYFGIDPIQSLLVLAVQGVVAIMLVLFPVQAGFGFTRQRLEREQAQHGIAGGGSAAPSAGNRQAYIGLVGTIITAVLSLISALLTALLPLFYGGGATGG